MKQILLLCTVLLLFVSCTGIASADALTLTPDRIDSYLVYVGFGETQRTEYNFVASRDLTECEIPNATCVIDGHTVIVTILVDDNMDSFESTLKVEDDAGNVATSDLIIRVKDIGASLDIAPINASCGDFTTFVVCEDEQITGIRWWLIVLLGVLLTIAAGHSMLRD